MRRAAAAAAAMLLAGCGGGEGGDRGIYERMAAAICTDYASAIARLGQPTRFDDIGRYLDDAMPVLTRAVERIERLEPPRDLAEEFDAFREHARETVERAQALRSAARRADSTEVQRLLTEAAAARRQRAELARAAGLERCASL